MARFDVYPNPSASERRGTPYFHDVQNDFIDGLETRVVIPLRRAARNFSGDVVAVARAPDGALYAMLADATGHGLAAAVSVLPALGAFYRGAARNVALEVLVTEPDDMLCGLLPPGHFVASALVRLDAGKPSGRLCVGGVPDILFVDDAGEIAQSFTVPPAAPGHPAVGGGRCVLRGLPVVRGRAAGALLRWSDRGGERRPRALRADRVGQGAARQPPGRGPAQPAPGPSAR